MWEMIAGFVPIVSGLFFTMSGDFGAGPIETFFLASRIADPVRARIVDGPADFLIRK